MRERESAREREREREKEREGERGRESGAPSRHQPAPILPMMRFGPQVRYLIRRNPPMSLEKECV
jgi:hypothetical protein